MKILKNKMTFALTMLTMMTSASVAHATPSIGQALSSWNTAYQIYFTQTPDGSDRENLLSCEEGLLRTAILSQCPNANTSSSCQFEVNQGVMKAQILATVENDGKLILELYSFYLPAHPTTSASGYAVGYQAVLSSEPLTAAVLGGAMFVEDGRVRREPLSNSGTLDDINIVLNPVMTCAQHQAMSHR